MRTARLLVLASLLVACGSPPAKAPEGGPVDEEPAPDPTPRPAAKHVEPAPDPTPPPAPDLPTAQSRCKTTRDQRVHSAKEAITLWRSRTTALATLTTFVHDHKCELKDDKGTIDVSKDAGADEVAAAKVSCNVKTVPPELTIETLREVLLRDATPDDENMFSTYKECDDFEQPTLRFRYKDSAEQDAILKLP